MFSRQGLGSEQKDGRLGVASTEGQPLHPLREFLYYCIRMNIKYRVLKNRVKKKDIKKESLSHNVPGVEPQSHSPWR